MEFGILGTARIARKSVMLAIRASDYSLGAIASRDAERAAALAEEMPWGIQAVAVDSDGNEIVIQEPVSVKSV